MKKLPRAPIHSNSFNPRFIRSFIRLFVNSLIFFIVISVATPTPALATCTGDDGQGCTSNSNYPISCSGPSTRCCSDDASCTGYQQSFNTSTWYKQDVKSFSKNVFDPGENEINSDRYAKYTVDSIAASLGIAAIGGTGSNGNSQAGAVTQLGQAIAFMSSQRPVNTTQYLAYMGSKAGISQVYAQGTGYKVLKPILPIWIAFRNIAYLFVAIVFVVVGFMIMMRKKIDPQTVIGIQQAIPRIIVTLLLITFSYAIAGLVVDLMYFSIYFIIGIFEVFQLITDKKATLDAIMNHSAIGLGIRAIFVDGTTTTGADALGNIINGILGVEGPIMGAISSFLGQAIGFLIIAIAILYAVFKLFFQLLMAYIQIIVGTIIGPLQIMLNAMPGSESFGKWFRNLLANAAAFPAAAAMFILAAILLGLGSWGVAENIGFADQADGVKWLPPLINMDADAAAAGEVNVVDAIQALIAIGLIMMTPKVVEMTKEALQAPEFKYGSAIGEAFGFAGRTARWPGGVIGRESLEKERFIRERMAIGGAPRDQAEQAWKEYKPPAERWKSFREDLIRRGSGN